MAIDLSKCVGCHACVLACCGPKTIFPSSARNRSPRGASCNGCGSTATSPARRERPERVDFQPVPCQQCETAPCEQVCPVAATTHSPDGLNEMTHNRCIGTRYCSNNCSTRCAASIFSTTIRASATEKMAMNPDVTVRMRGVMEKCTYCAQRIARARVKAKAEQEVRDGEVLDRLPAGLPRAGDRLRQPGRSQLPSGRRQARPAQLRSAGRVQLSARASVARPGCATPIPSLKGARDTVPLASGQPRGTSRSPRRRSLPAGILRRPLLKRSAALWKFPRRAPGSSPSPAPPR